MLWPYLDVPALIGSGSTSTTVGALCAITAAFTNSGAVIQTRRLTDSETTASIVFYFSLICTFAGLVTLPFAWVTPSPTQLAALIAIGIIGGLSHIFLTESYRWAPASVDPHPARSPIGLHWRSRGASAWACMAHSSPCPQTR